MIKIHRLQAQGGEQSEGAVIDYFLTTQAITSYYAGSAASQDALRWYGKGADDLGLLGKPVDAKVMTMLAKGFSPTNEPLCRNAGAEASQVEEKNSKGEVILDENGQPKMKWVGGHRIGFDMVMSPPKSVSVAMAFSSPEERGQIIQAHRQAVAKALEYLESKVETRRGKGGKDYQEIEGLVITQADHLTNRDLEPQLHTHNLIYGVAKGTDGKWSTFDARELYNHRHAADQLYKAELASSLKALGYGITQSVERDSQGFDKGIRTWEMAGVDEKLNAHYSKRREEILSFMQEHGVSDQVAWAQTRKDKAEPPYDELLVQWESERKALGFHFDAKDLRQDSTFQEIDEKAKFDLVAETLTQNQSIFTDKDMVVAIGDVYAGELNSKELLATVDKFKSDYGLITLKAQDIHEADKGDTLARIHTEDRYTTPYMLKVEQAIQQRAIKRQGESYHHVKEDLLAQAIENYQDMKGFTLSDEQVNAITHATQKSGGVAVISGLAGTGKTTTSEVTKHAFESQGFTVIGCAVAKKAADKLQAETGIKSHTISSLLQQLSHDQLTLKQSDVILMDEAGMVGARDTLALMEYADKAGAKLILQGDTEQLQPISAGSAMSLVKGQVGEAKLTEIRRQKDEGWRDLAKAFYDLDQHGSIIERERVKSRQQVQDKSLELFAKLQGKDAIHENTEEHIKSHLVADYFKSDLPHSEKLILIHTHADSQAITSIMREEMKGRGELEGKEAQVKTFQNDEFHTIQVAKGERMMFTKNDRRLDINNGTEFVVDDISYGKHGEVLLSVTIEDDDPMRNGRSLLVDTSQTPALTYAYAKTIHKAQGQGKSQVFHLANVGMLDNQSALVGMTRLTDGHYGLYGSYDDIQDIKGRLGMDRLKENAADYLLDEPVKEKTALKKSDTEWLDKHIKVIAEGIRSQQVVEQEGQTRKRSQVRSL